MNNENERINGLIKQLQSGNKRAFDEFYKLTSPKAYFIALKITENEHDAKDVLQESYIKALEKLDEIDTSQNVMSWFCKIVANKSKDLIKSKKPLVFENEDESFFAEIPEDKTEFIPEENLNQEELRLEVMAAIDELTAEKRACIMMMYFGDMSVKEIAESIEVPESTVKNRLYTARKDLKTKFEKSGNILYGAALGGIIIWALQKTSVTASAAFAASAASAEILAGIGASAAYSAATGASATAAATGGGIAAKVAALSIVQKVAVGIAATAVVGGSTAGVVTVVKTVTDKPEPTTLTEEVTTAVVPSTEYVFNEMFFPEETTENSSFSTSETTSERVSANTSGTSATRGTTTAPHTTAVTEPSTQRATTTRPEITTQTATTTRPTTTEPTTTRPKTTTPTTVPTTVPTTQAPARLVIEVVDMDENVVATLNLTVEAGTEMTWEYLVAQIKAKGYEPMAGIYGDGVGAVAESGTTYTFTAEL